MLIFYREQNNLNYPAFVEKKTIIKGESKGKALIKEKQQFLSRTGSDI